MKKTKINILLLFILICISNSYADWIQKGPYRGIGNFNCITKGHGYWYGGGTNGVYKSTSSNPDFWIQVNSGLSDTNVISVGTFGFNVFAGTNTGIYKSIDFGNNWLPCNNGLPLNPCRVIYSYNNYIYVGTDLGLYCSIDTAQSWFQINTGLPSTFITSIFQNSSYLYCGTNGNGLHRSSDSGQTWVDINSNLPVGLTVSDIKLDNQYLYLATLGNGLFRSNDSGISWQQINTGLQTLLINKIAINQNILFLSTQLGIYTSIDQGDNWILNNQISWAVNGIEFNSVAMVAATDNYGLYKTNTLGTLWLNETNGLPKIPYNIFFIKKNNDLLYVGSNEGLFVSEDSAETWFQIKSDFNADVIVTSLVSLGNNKMLCCAYTTGYSGHIYLSDDNGFNWTLINLPIIGSYKKLSFSSSRIVAVGDGDGSNIYPIITSNDSGLTWTPTSINGISSGSGGLFINDVYVYNDQTYLVGVENQNIYRTTNGGTTWINTNSGPNYPYHQFYYSDSVLYSTNGYNSSNLGVNWNSYFDIQNIDYIRSVRVENSRQLVGGSTFNFMPQIYMSLDSGFSWSDWSEGLYGSNWIDAIEIDSIYAYAGGRGVFRRNINDVISNIDIPTQIDEQFYISFHGNKIQVINKSRSEFSFQIYNNLGQKITENIDGYEECSLNLAAGLYICHLTYGNEVRSIKFVVNGN